MSSTGLATPQPQAQAPDVPALVAGRGLTVRFGAQLVLDHVDVAIRPGEIVTLVGLNGAGKSTLARALLGLVPLSAGTLTRRPGLRVGYLPQSLERDPTLPLTVTRFVSLAGPASRGAIAAQLAELGISDLAKTQMAALSGGELRRVLLARALLRRPQLLVLDEPMAGVDVSGQAELYRMIATIRKTHGCGVLLISHDLHLVMAETDIVICLNHHVCCAGRPQSVVRDPRFAEVFGQDVADALAIYRHEHDHVHDPHGDVHPSTYDHGPTGHTHGHTHGVTAGRGPKDPTHG